MKKRAMYFKQIQGGILMKKKNFGIKSTLNKLFSCDNIIWKWNYYMTLGKYTYIHILCIFILRNYHLIARCLLICITLFLPFSEHLFLVLFPPLHPKKNNQNFRVKKKSKLFLILWGDIHRQIQSRKKISFNRLTSVTSIILMAASCPVLLWRPYNLY